MGERERERRGGKQIVHVLGKPGVLDVLTTWEDTGPSWRPLPALCPPSLSQPGTRLVRVLPSAGCYVQCPFCQLCNKTCKPLLPGTAGSFIGNFIGKPEESCRIPRTHFKYRPYSRGR